MPKFPITPETKKDLKAIAEKLPPIPIHQVNGKGELMLQGIYQIKSPSQDNRATAKTYPSTGEPNLTDHYKKLSKAFESEGFEGANKYIAKVKKQFEFLKSKKVYA